MMTKEVINNNRVQSVSDIDKQTEASHAASVLTPKEATHPFSPLRNHFRVPLESVLTGGNIKIIHYKQDPEQRLWEDNPFERTLQKNMM